MLFFKPDLKITLNNDLAMFVVLLNFNKQTVPGGKYAHLGFVTVKTPTNPQY